MVSRLLPPTCPARPGPPRHCAVRVRVRPRARCCLQGLAFPCRLARAHAASPVRAHGRRDCPDAGKPAALVTHDGEASLCAGAAATLLPRRPRRPRPPRRSHRPRPQHRHSIRWRQPRQPAAPRPRRRCRCAALAALALCGAALAHQNRHLLVVRALALVGGKMLRHFCGTTSRLSLLL